VRSWIPYANIVKVALREGDVNNNLTRVDRVLLSELCKEGKLDLLVVPGKFAGESRPKGDVVG
jgi:hypothetical protein